MDLNALQQKINNYITVVSSWVRNVGKLYFSGTPENVTVELLDDSGNIVTKSIPNVAQFRKRVWDDVGGALGQFNRIFYVDVIEGNDTNDGSGAYPFKTLKKAINSIPVGGRGKILIKTRSGENVSISENGISIIKKYVTINKIGDGSVSIDKLSDSYDFGIYNSFLKTDGIDWNGKAKDANTTYDYNWVANMTCRNSAVAVYNATVNIDNGSFVTNVDNYGESACFFYNVDVTTTSDSIALIKTGGAPTLFTFKNGSTIDNDTKLVANIVKDTNGIPRNIVSNIVF